MKSSNLRFITPWSLLCFIVSQGCQIGAVYCVKLINNTPFDWSNPYYYLCVLAIVGQAVSLYQVLKTTPMSLVYPATGIQLPLLLLLGWWAFDEYVSSLQVIGILVVLVGLYLLINPAGKESK